MLAVAHKAIVKRFVVVESRNLRKLTHHRLQEVQCNRSDQSHQDNVPASHLLRHQFWLTLQLGVAGYLAQTACSADKNVICAGFRKEEEKEDQTESTQPHEYPDWPRPVNYLVVSQMQGHVMR